MEKAQFPHQKIGEISIFSTEQVTVYVAYPINIWSTIKGDYVHKTYRTFRSNFLDSFTWQKKKKFKTESIKEGQLNVMLEEQG